MPFRGKQFPSILDAGGVIEVRAQGLALFAGALGHGTWRSSGFAGIVIGLAAGAVMYLWPAKRWIGYCMFAGAFLLCGYWGWTARKSSIEARNPQQRAVAPVPVVIQKDEGGDCSNIVAGHDAKIDCAEKDNGEPQK